MPEKTLDLYQMMERRRDDLKDFLSEKETGNLIRDHKHLDKGTTEQAYWHLGYYVAIKDILDRLKQQKGTIQ